MHDTILQQRPPNNAPQCVGQVRVCSRPGPRGKQIVVRPVSWLIGIVIAAVFPWTQCEHSDMWRFNPYVQWRARSGFEPDSRLTLQA